MTLTLRSPAFDEGAEIPEQYTCEGDNHAPTLRWDGVPSGTQSFVLLVDDPDASKGTFTHWVLFDIPASVRELTEGQPAIGMAGTNDFQNPDYNGPCPPPGDASHRYVFTLYALDLFSLGLKRRATRGEVEAAIQGHILGQAQLTGRYARGEQRQRGG
jgi:Raf kinase inhibitor-like YbhB/YbcL family protein